MTDIVPISRTSITYQGLRKVDVWLKTNNSMNLLENGDFIVSGENGKMLPKLKTFYG